MISKFTVSNYLSFKNPTSFSMEATAIKEHFSSNVENSGQPKIDLLKSSAFFGWNSSGKSNMIKAINFMKEMVINSYSLNSMIRVNYQLNSEYDDKSSEFEIEFFIKGLKYIYGFEINNERILSEKLYFVKITKPIKVFERVTDNYTFGKNNQPLKEVTKFTRQDSLFLSVAAQFNYQLAGELVSWFKSIKILYGAENLDMEDTYDAANKPKYFKLFGTVLQNMQLGFNALTIEKEESLGQKINYQLMAIHNKFDAKGKKIGQVKFNLLERESLGTRKILAMAGPIIKALVDGTLIIIDEFDARLHPGLVRSLIKLFHSSINNNGAQLIIATHNTAILKKDIYRRDQIFIVEKAEEGFSIVWSLSQTGIRNDAAYDLAYLQAKYNQYPSLKKSMELDLLE